jgi:hypothetical protein
MVTHKYTRWARANFFNVVVQVVTIVPLALIITSRQHLTPRIRGQLRGIVWLQPSPKLEDETFSPVHDYLFDIFWVTLDTASPISKLSTRYAMERIQHDEKLLIIQIFPTSCYLGPDILSGTVL